jgi:CRP-like cAMP-binding protein
VALLTASVHSATAIARTEVRAAVLTAADLTELVRQRPDIGAVLYRNLARGLGEKLRRADLGRAASS